MILTSEDNRQRYREQGHWGEQRLHDPLFVTAEKHPDRIALVDPANKSELCGLAPQRWTYGELTQRVNQLACVLLQQGIAKDDILLVQMPNIVELVLVYLAASKLGAVVSPVPVQYQARELSNITQVLNPKAAISVAEFKDRTFGTHLRAALEQFDSIPLWLWGSSNDDDLQTLSDQINSFEPLQEYTERTPVTADDVVTICWTSGTEGIPKGIPRSHNQWFCVGKATYEGNAMQEGEVLLNPFPFINMASIGGLFLSWLYSGGKLVLHHPMNLPVFLQQIVEEQVTYTLAPPALLNSLLKDERLISACDQAFSSSRVRAIGSGSAPLDDWMVAGFKQRYGIEVVNHFGSNEGVSLVCGPEDTHNPEKRARLFARESKIMQSRLVDPESGTEVTESGVCAELQIRGPGVFDGYFKDPEKTSASFTDDGYFKTGDLFEVLPQDSRFYRFVGRCKDLIIRGGMNIAPAELDNLISAHHDVLEAAVAGYPCDLLGERVAAFVVSKSGQSLSLDAIVTFLKSQQLANFKLPEKLVMVQTIPRNPLGKVLRQKLSDSLIAR
ncbi:acyl--CoA ligase [Pseudomaricurvus alkylphenolicus]|uniref:class I adenylate-forming enzyme family protein n=1 Tax=Pseudomaricurvus alkylphenolicus TaxID=1306991 RepID=UPI0014214B64|nr:class I adenylate-forming enzyme family protein [Pseudomaricurvus alkylphenolicus]NIB43341.1 acyl--CoA ligase [Pseudomaricurvus alkylphenolicus]